MHITTRSRICRCRWSLTYQINSKEASGKACEIWLKFRLRGNFSNSANMDTPCCHAWKVAIYFSNLNFIHIERITTNYQTLQTWVGLNVTCTIAWTLYHTRDHIFSLRLAWFWAIWNPLPRVSIIFSKKLLIFFLKIWR